MKKERKELICREVTDICLDNGGVTKPMADKLTDYVVAKIEDSVKLDRLQQSANIFARFRQAMMLQVLSARPDKGTRFMTPEEELSVILSQIEHEEVR